MKYEYTCPVCGVIYKSSRQRSGLLCHKCSTKGSDTKEAICNRCGNTFILYRNPNDENRFEKKTICENCSTSKCRICKKPFASAEEGKKRNYLCEECKPLLSKENDENYLITLPDGTKFSNNGRFTRIDNNGHYYSVCSRCKIEIEVDPIPRGKTKRIYPYGKLRKLCDKCYDEFMRETKDIVCKNCGKTFTVGRSKTDCGFLLRDTCPDCYENLYHYDTITRTCEFCGKQFDIYRNADGNFTVHKKYCPDCEYKNDLIKQRREATLTQKYGKGVTCGFLTPQCLNSKDKTGVISKVNLRFANKLEKTGIKYEMEWYDENHHRHYDFYLPVSDTLIEINPTYTHSILGNAYQGLDITDKQMEYKKWQHLNRTQDIDKRVIHVWDWDSWDKIIELIKPKQKLYARQLTVKEITNKDEIKIFLNCYHLKGNCRSKDVCLGLYDKNNNLIQVMVFGKPRYNKKYQWENLRLCTKFGYYIVGGAQKLFKHFVRGYNPESVISYCDYSKFTGKVYEQLGFNFLKLNYPSKIWSKGSEFVLDSLLRQRGYDQLFKTNYGKGTSNEQLMIDNGWLPIYDCGQKVFVWSNNDI